MKKLALAVLLAATPASAQVDSVIRRVTPVTSTGTLTAVSQSVVIDVGGYGSVAIQLTGTWTATVGFDGTVDGTNWVDLQVVPTTSATAVTTSTGNGIWYVVVGGLNQVRAFTDLHSSGTVQVDMQANISSGKTVPAAGAAGGTSMTDDATFTPGSTAITPGGAMFDDVAPDSVDEGDAGIPRMSANRVPYSTIRDAAGNERGANVTAASELSVIASAQPGVDIGDVTLNNAVVSVDDNAGSLTIDGTVDLGATDNAVLDSIDAATTAIQTAVEGTLTVGSHAVTNAGTFVVQEDGAALTALELIDDVVSTDDTTTHSTGSTKVQNMGAVATPTDGSVGANDIGMVAMSLDRRLHADAQIVGQDAALDVSGAVVSVDDNAASLTVDATNLDIRNLVPGQDTVQIGDGVETATVRDTGTSDSLNVAIVDASGDQITTFGGGTEYTEDAVAEADPVGGAVILVREDGPVLVAADGDNVAQRATGYGAAYSQIVDSSGNFVDSFGGGTQYAEDTATAAGEQLTMAGAVRQDATGTLVSDDQDRTVLSVDASGRLWTNPSDVTSPISAASLPLPTGAATSAAQLADNHNVTANAGTDLNTSALLTTAAHDAALGTAGSADSQVRTVQGVASMTPVTVNQRGTIDSGNSTTTPLGIDANFTGSYVDVSDVESIVVSVFADEASATDGLLFQWSSDGTNVDVTSSSEVLASAGRAYALSPRAQFFRVNYTNGSTGQGAFRLETILRSGVIDNFTRPLDKAIDDTYYAQLGRVVIAAKRNDDTYGNVRSTNGDNLKVSISEFDGVGTGDAGRVFIKNPAGTDMGSAGEPVRVDPTGSTTQPVSAASLPLPSGAATAAAQATQETDLESIVTNTTGLAGTVSGSELQVDVLTSALPAGAATSAAQLPDGHDVTVDNAAGAAAVNVQDGGNSLTVDGSVTANAGTDLNTSALLTTTAHDAAFGTAGSADAQVRTVQGVASMTPLLVNGSAVTQPVSGTVTSNAGTGTRTVGQATASSLNAQVVGNVASAATDGGNPVKVGAVFNTTQPTVTTGQRVNLQASNRGSLLVAVQGQNLTRPIYCQSTADLDMTTATTTQIVALSASTHVYICSYAIHVGGAADVKLVSGTGSNCVTGQADITTNYDFAAADAGINRTGGGGNVVARTAALADAVCVTSSAAVDVSVEVSYAQF